ncbi:hypothetical protein [Granulicella sibirica]|uniref:Uncharacterized protein n=1 Tax=Granulicella sibirica TaxID=2479048 RepID=A0A4Q0T7H1_9BACT|nr:hypothetical protein [Granulicella sibirica]RXH57551.1 hypothetical protein GRAN_0861 [Granulicella sibirica]
MGLTIHYQGQLQSEASCERFLTLVKQFAAERNWPAHAIDEAKKQLTRTLQPEDPHADEYEEVYLGPTRGVYLLPHPECEPLTFEFDRDLFMQDCCKTQFAGAAVHEQIIQLFHKTENLFEMLDVQDEAEFWEKGDVAALENTFAYTRMEIDKTAAEMPGSSVAVLTPSGRILDVLGE